MTRPSRGARDVLTPAVLDVTGLHACHVEHLPNGLAYVSSPRPGGPHAVVELTGRRAARRLVVRVYRDGHTTWVRTSTFALGSMLAVLAQAAGLLGVDRP